MAGASHDHDDTKPPTLPPEREARRQEAARIVGVLLLKTQHEEGLLELEDAVRGAMIGIGEVLGQHEGGYAYFARLCSYYGQIAEMLRDRPPTSRGLQ